MNVITLVEHEIEAGWNWVITEATALYDAVSPLVDKALTIFKDSVIADLWGAAAAFVQKVVTVTSLPDLETAFLNTVELLGHDLLKAAQTLGSSILQALLGLLHATANLEADVPTGAPV